MASTQEPPWNLLLGQLSAHTASSLVFWALLDQLPRDVYWFCLEEMNLSAKLAFLALLFALPFLLWSRRVRLYAAQYGSVLDCLGLVCIFVRFHPDATLHLVTSCVGLVLVATSRFSLWSFASQLKALSSDGSVTEATLSVTGLVLANFVTVALRWGNKSLNPLVPGLADILVTTVVCHVPVACACIFMFVNRSWHLAVDAPPLSVTTGPSPWWHSMGSIMGTPLALFVTQWVFGSPTSIPRWLGISTDWSWVFLLVYVGGALVAQVFPGHAMVAVWTAGVLCFGASTILDVQLAGAVCMALALPSMWIGLVPATTPPTFAVHVNSATHSTNQDPRLDKLGSFTSARVNSQGPITHTALSSSAASTGLCATSCLGTLAYIFLTALTIILTCYDYLPDELRFLRGQRYQLVVAAGLLLSVSYALTLFRPRPQRRWRLVRWNAMFALRAVVAGGLVVGVLCPVAIVRLAINLHPGNVLPPEVLLGVKSDLRIFSFNVYQGFNRAGHNNFEPVLNAIKDYLPHMVALQVLVSLPATSLFLINQLMEQESDTLQAGSGAVDITDYLAQKLGMYSYAHPRTDQDSFGCTFLSVFPIVESESMGVILPSPRGENACMQVVKVDVLGTHVTVVNVHLGNDGMAEKQAQLDATAKAVVAAATGPLILVGDFNTRKNTPQYTAFVQKAGQLRDAGTAAHCRQTFNDTGTPIEYIFFRNVTCVQFDYPHTYPQDETADSFPRIGHFNLSRT